MMENHIVYRGTRTWTSGATGDNEYDPNSTAWGFTNLAISNSDCLALAFTNVCYSDKELLKQLEAEASRRRDLGYLVPRRPPLKRLRYHVAAPHIRFIPVLRQPRCAHRCHRQVFRSPGLRRRFVCRNASLVALRVNARA